MAVKLPVHSVTGGACARPRQRGPRLTVGVGRDEAAAERFDEKEGKE
jgi:hypothetical protein